MTENVTSDIFSDEAAYDAFADAYWISEYFAHFDIIVPIFEFYLSFLTVTGIPCNILALVILIRRRFWLHHEAYIYLAAILIINTVKVTFDYGSWFLSLLFGNHWSWITVDFVCKFWTWLVLMVSHMQWLDVLMLFNVLLRQQLLTPRDRRGCFMNLAAKYCSLLGTKFVIGSFLIVCALANLGHFWTARLLDFSGYKHCSSSDGHFALHKVLSSVSRWLEVAAFLSVIVLLVLVVWKRRRGRRSDGFVFSQMNGASQDKGDVEATVRVVVFCVAAVAVLKAPLQLTHLLLELGFDHKIYKVVDALQLISAAYPLSTPIVLFSVKSRFRDELRTMVSRCCLIRCCPGASCHGITLSPDPPESDRRTFDLQLNIIEDDSSVAGIAEDSRSNCHSVDISHP